MRAASGLGPHTSLVEVALVVEQHAIEGQSIASPVAA